MESIGKLHEDDAYVLDHGQNHFAEALRLRFGTTIELNLVQFADAVDQVRDLVAKHRLEILQIGRGVLDDVVQNGGRNRLAVHVHLRECLRHGDRVGDVGFAAQAGLPIVGFRAKLIGLDDFLDLLSRHVGSRVPKSFCKPLNRRADVPGNLESKVCA